MSDRKLEEAKKRASGVLTEKFGAPKSRLERQYRKVRRHMPSHLRRDVETIFETEKQLANPITARRVNTEAALKAQRRLERKSRNIDLERSRVRGRYLLANELFSKMAILALIAWGAFAYFI